MNITGKQIRGYFPWLTTWQKSVYDADYWCPCDKFMYDVANDVYDFLKKNGLLKWREFWDCDDFAHTYAFFARVRYAKMRKEFPEMYTAQSVAIGEVSYIVWKSKAESSGAAHRINFYITPDGQRKFLEPQFIKAMMFGKEFVELKPVEIKSIYRMAV